jgi:zinc finger SWIM domain-containing protein 3
MKVSGICKHQIMDSMLKWHDSYDKVGFTVSDIYNFCHCNKLQMLSAGDTETIMNYLIAQKRRDLGFHFDHKRDGGGHMTGVIWCDFQSQMDYRDFGDVTVFDDTYRTNKYNLPLVFLLG